jgi:hypothetical protein
MVVHHYKKKMVSVLVFLLLPCLSISLFAGEQLQGEWERFPLTGRALSPRWGASSVLESDEPLRESRYGPEKALDGDPGTAWVEGVPGPGIGESFFLALEHIPEAFGFYNGYAKNQNLFNKNHRVKELKVRIYAALMVDGFGTEIADFFDAIPIMEPVKIELADSMEAQRVPLPVDRSMLESLMADFRRSRDVVNWSFPQAREMGLDGSEGLSLHFRYIIRIEIGDIYPGSAWEDTCIAELWPDYGTAEKVSVSGDSRSLVITRKSGEEIPVYGNIEYVLTLFETSRDNKWALVIREPAYPGPGERITSSYAVLYTPGGRDVSALLFNDPSGLGTDLLPFGFISREGRTWLEYEDLRSGEIKEIHCTLY